MRNWLLTAAGGLLLLFTAPVHSQATDSARAKTYLKEHLRRLNKDFPFPDWEDRLAKAWKSLGKIKSKNDPAGGFDRDLGKPLAHLAAEMDELAKLRPQVDRLINELYVAVITARIDALFKADGLIFASEPRRSFQQSLLPFEAGSLKPKQAFLVDLFSLEREFRQLQNDWLFAYAQGFLGRRTDEHLRQYDFAKNAALYDDYALQLEYWTKEIPTNAAQAHAQFLLLSQKFDGHKAMLRLNLESLLDALQPDMLFSDLLEQARRDKVEFTVAVEEKIEASLKERSKPILDPIKQRIEGWKVFAAALRERVGRAYAQTEIQKSQAVAREEAMRREQESLEALRREQQRQAEEQKAKFKQTLTALKTFSFGSENQVALDADARKALSTKAGNLKTSYVGSGQVKLKVEKDKFSDTLMLVQKFSVKGGKGVDFSKMSLQERSSQSAYTYPSASGRTSKDDLENFVAEVALGSFSTYYSFLSYVAPRRWTPGRVDWMSERAGMKESKDREWSYVDLVVDAHRKRPGAGKSVRGEHVANLPANMIVIFDAKGAIIRYQSFADVGQVSIRPADLVGGKLRYKFLNYSVDRRNIYLNGIDGEMKVAAPGGKS